MSIFQIGDIVQSSKRCEVETGFEYFRGRIKEFREDCKDIVIIELFDRKNKFAGASPDDTDNTMVINTAWLEHVEK